MTDDRKRFLEDAVKAADRLASRHADDCPINGLAKAMSQSMRAELAGGGGPAQVASDAYRDGWTTIFGKHQKAGEA